jgi:hypothetical protein
MKAKTKKQVANLQVKGGTSDPKKEEHLRHRGAEF